MPARLPGRLQDCDLTDSAIFGSSTELPANEHTSPKQIPAAHLHPDYELEHEGDSTPPSDASDASSSNAAAGNSAHHRHSLHKLIHRRNSTHIKGSRREKVTMVAHSLHSAFKSWFRDTESDGSPVLPSPLSKKYEVLPSVLGEGSFAVVKPVVERATGTKRALKIIAKKPLKGSNEKMLKEEINILGKVVHPNIIKMWDLYETKEGVFIVTDLCRGGELFDRLVEKVHYNELDARHIMKQIFEGVAYLHDHDIIHRDLKPENILLKDKEEPSHIVISDFGLSKFIPHDGLLMTACGSPQYVSPEVLLGKGYSSGVDIWSSGVIAYCLLGGYTPFYGDDQPTLFQQILAMKVEFEPQYWDEISSTAKDFILKCLCPADKRMTAREALEHPWLADLPELHPELCNDIRGACLKEKAQKNLSSFRKVSRAVTAVEAVNYLQRLHTLRKEHSPDAHPEALHSLMRMASNISSHQGVDASHTLSSGAGGGAARSAPEASHRFDLTASTETVTPQNEDAEMGAPESSSGEADDVKPKPKKEDSGMSLDLIIMTAFLPPDPPGILPPKKDEAQDKKAAKDAAAGTAAVAEAAEATTNTTAADRAPSPDSDSTEMPPKKPAAQRNGSSKKGASKATSEALNTLLDQYNSTERPSSARIDPAVKARVPEKLTLANSWRYVPFLMNQTYSIGSALASHAFYGPLKKSWGIEMSVFTRLMRDTAEYSQFASVDGLQQFFELASLLPTPKDGLITPVTFRVKKRNLRGLLAEADAAEDGKRELSGEWVVGKHTWRRLQSEWRNGQQKGKERVILYIHGGAYFVMSATTHRPLTIALSKYTECRVFSINYRLAPGTIFPGALHDVVSSWFRLVDDLGIPPSNIVLGADSAGGGLAMALMYYLRDNKYDLPGGAMLFSPWVDLTMSCDSWETNANFDYLPMPKPGDHMNPIYAYLGENIDKYLTHPYVSPLFGDMKGLPPLLIQCGDAELLRDEVTLLAHKASVSGVAVRHELYEDCVHVFQVFLFLDASRKALQSARHFVRTALDKRGERKGRVTDEATGALNKEMREKMEDTKGARVEPRTGKSLEDKEGKRQAQSDEEDDDEPNMGDEQWEFDGDNFASRKASDASKAAHASVQASAKAAFGMDDGDAAKATDPPKDGQGADTASSSGANTPLAVPRFHGSSDMRRSRTQPNSPVSTMRPLSNARDAPSSTSPSSSWHQRGLSTSLTQNSLEEARARANAGMRAQHGRAAPPLSPFHAPKQPLAPKIRNRSKSGSNLVLDDLVRSFQSEGKGALQTRVYTPDEA